jgi:hypothetical protein
MTPQAPDLVSSFGVAKTSTLKLGTNAITCVTDAEEVAEYSTFGICSKNILLSFCERFKL